MCVIIAAHRPNPYPENLLLPAAAGVLVWDYLTQDRGEGKVSIKPAGLAARDTLRLEAAMPLYGHELSEDIDPLSAGCGWCVDLETDFIGVDALRRINSEGPRRRMTGLVLEGKRIARQSAKVLAGDTEVGVVTSGTLSPTLGKPIALAYVDAAHSTPEAKLSVDLRGARVGATVIPQPFYRRNAE